jgi:hypothetical protein
VRHRFRNPLATDQTLDGKSRPAYPVLPLNNGSPDQSQSRTTALHQDRSQHRYSCSPRRWVTRKWINGSRTKDNETRCQRHSFLPFSPTQEDMSRLQKISSDTIGNGVVVGHMVL